MFKLYGDWKKEGRQVRKGERSYKRNALGQAVFHQDQTDPQEKSADDTLWRLIVTGTSMQALTGPLNTDPSAVRDYQAMVKRANKPTGFDKAKKGPAERPLCPLELVYPLPNAWGR
jgi:hypothetical protein